MKTNQTTRKRLTGGIVAVILLTICLVVTTYALVCYTVYVPNNIFHTGKVDIELNEGKPVIGPGAPIYPGDENVSSLFEPGMRVVKKFFIRNQTQWDCYCRLYFSVDEKNSDMALAKALQVTVKDSDQNVLYSGTMSQLESKNNGTFVLKGNKTILEGKNWYTMEFYLPGSIGNEVQKQELYFDICADATQMKNNGSDSKGEDKSVKFNDYGERNHFDDNTHEDKHIEEKGTSTP